MKLCRSFHTLHRRGGGTFHHTPLGCQDRLLVQPFLLFSPHNFWAQTKPRSGCFAYLRHCGIMTVHLKGYCVSTDTMRLGVLSFLDVTII